MAHRPPLLSRHDPAAALSLLTRLPVPAGPGAAARRAAAAWAWPLAGLLVGAAAGAAALGALALGAPSGVAAALALALQALLTGALHEDGLADCADGFWGGGTPERRLEIMRDSRIGSYGVLALVLTLLVRWSSLAALPPAALLPVLAAAGALSRAPMGLGMAVLPFARAGGLAVAVGRPPLPAAVLGLVLSLLAAAVLLGSAAALPALAGLAAAAAVACLARAKIGGQTGDVVGAMQQAAEATALAAAAALLTGG